jgi:hypothetical protein
MYQVFKCRYGCGDSISSGEIVTPEDWFAQATAWAEEHCCKCFLGKEE